MKRCFLLVLVVLFLPLATAQTELNIENSHKDYDRYQEAWRMASVADVEAWLQTNPDINAHDSNSWPVLVRAAHHNQNPEVVKRLLEAGASPNQRYLSGYTALMAAAQWNTPEVVQTLIEGGADVNAKDEGGETVLMYAAKWNADPEVLSTLVAAGSDVQAVDKYGFNLLMLAADSNTSATVIQILLQAGLDVNASTESGMTALMIASMSWDWNSRPDVLKALIEGGVSVDALGGFGRTALMYATSRNNIDLVTVLLQAGADPLLEAKDGSNALDIATVNNYLEILNLLKTTLLKTEE